MQSLTWYLRRLQSMSASELAWRLRSTLRDSVDQPRFSLGLFPGPEVIPSLNGNTEEKLPFRVSDMRVGEWAAGEDESAERAWYRCLIHQADQIAAHRLSFFNLESHDLGSPIDWNRDHESGKPSPPGFAPKIDYRDYDVTGDTKLVWEPNRHHQLVILGRAYRASGDLCHATAVVEQLESWWQQCPFGQGMNWRSPLELAIRLINWVWAIDLIQESGLVTGEFRLRLLHSVYLHLWEITRKYSQGSSANNHRIGEAAGVFIATSYFCDFAEAARWHKESQNILGQEIVTQTYPDGCGREQALGYHLFILEFFLVAGIVARQIGSDFPQEYWARVEHMLQFLGVLHEGTDQPFLFGDCDDGHVLDLGGSRDAVHHFLSVGAVLYNRSDFKTWAGEYVEPTRWLLGRASRAQFDALESRPAAEALASHAFPDSGHYLLQCGQQGKDDSVSLTFDCAELGFQSIAAHGHADALHFTLRAFGQEVFVDPGTYDYFRFLEWRNYFRSTRAHNTVVVDDADQSVMLGSFMWGERAQARCITWEPRSNGGTVVGEHDGYTRFADPVIHRRTLDLDGQSQTLTIRDDLLTGGKHTASLCFHLSEQCVVTTTNAHCYEIAVSTGTVTLEVDPRLSVQALTGSEKPIGGWVSRGYHQKVQTTTLLASTDFRGDTTFVCRITIGRPRPSA